MSGEDELSESDYDALEARFREEIRPLVHPGTLAEAIAKTRSWLASETRREARNFLLSELTNQLTVAGRDEESLVVIRERIELVPEDPLAWHSLAAWHFYCHGLYDADAGTLKAGFDANETAIQKARVAGHYLRYCLNERARIAVAMKRWDLLEETLREILRSTPRPREAADIRLEDDFLRRVPEGAINSELLGRYRAAFTAQEERRKLREQSEAGR